MWWNVTIRETLVRVVAVESEDDYGAIDAVWSRYRAGKIVLEADDFSDVEMEVKEAGGPSPRPQPVEKVPAKAGLFRMYKI